MTIKDSVHSLELNQAEIDNVQKLNKLNNEQFEKIVGTQIEELIQQDDFDEDPMWVFGYGSLIWKVDFPTVERVPGYIKGFVRRFWQGSNDHRGTPEAPGRVVTLIPIDEYKDVKETYEDHFNINDQEELITWGMAYRIPKSKKEEVKHHLDYREKNGYSCYTVDIFHPDKTEPVVKNASVYIGTLDNEAYLGPAPYKELAEHILKSVGPSGPNIEYFLNLHQAVKTLFPNAEDPHLEAIQHQLHLLADSKDVETH